MTNDIAPREQIAPSSPESYEMIPVEQIRRQAEQVKTLMASCMDDGTHYGKIPGCGDKPTLLQPGAQKLTLMFGFADTYEITREDLPNGHREYTVKCLLVSKSTGLVQGSGVGLCSTMEKKYRYRNVADFEVTDQPIPQDARERKQEYRRQGYGMKKVDGRWCWVRYKDSVAQENPDIADTYNTVLKMACKRALVAATLNTLAVSDLFTQDIEDLGEYAIDSEKQPRARQAKQYAPQPQEDPRKALWAEVTRLKSDVLGMGAYESGITSWMQANIRNEDGSPKPTKMFTADDVRSLRDHLRNQLEDLRQLRGDEQEAFQDAMAGDAEAIAMTQDLASEDIPF